MLFLLNAKFLGLCISLMLATAEIFSENCSSCQFRLTGNSSFNVLIYQLLELLHETMPIILPVTNMRNAIFDLDALSGLQDGDFKSQRTLQQSHESLRKLKF